MQSLSAPLSHRRTVRAWRALARDGGDKRPQKESGNRGFRRTSMLWRMKWNIVDVLFHNHDIHKDHHCSNYCSYCVHLHTFPLCVATVPQQVEMNGFVKDITLDFSKLWRSVFCYPFSDRIIDQWIEEKQMADTVKTLFNETRAFFSSAGVSCWPWKGYGRWMYGWMDEWMDG